jgi:uncharacterized protein (DUF1778 family)
MRVTPEQHALIRQAAAIKGKGLTVWVREITEREARRVIDRHERQQAKVRRSYTSQTPPKPLEGAEP